MSSQGNDPRLPSAAKPYKPQPVASQDLPMDYSGFIAVVFGVFGAMFRYKTCSWLAIIFSAQSLANMKNIETDLRQISMAMMGNNRSTVAVGLRSRTNPSGSFSRSSYAPLTPASIAVERRSSAFLVPCSECVLSTITTSRSDSILKLVLACSSSSVERNNIGSCIFGPVILYALREFLQSDDLWFSFCSTKTNVRGSR
nr:protein Asterix [Ipomoea batatas]